MHFAIAFDLGLPHNEKRIVTSEDCSCLHRTSKVRVSMARDYYDFKDLVVLSHVIGGLVSL